MDGGEKLWSRAIEAETGIKTAACYQCLRCSNSCPVSDYMDIKPHRVVRLTQLGQKEALLRSSTIWICISCEMCSTYCPNEIDVAALMNHLKNSAVNSLRKPAEYEIAAFHEAFMTMLQRYGRINDLQLMGLFRTGNALHGRLPSWKSIGRDFGLAFGLLRRKRLRFFPEKSPAARRLRRLLSQYGRKRIRS